jgi:hypothetical protein
MIIHPEETLAAAQEKRTAQGAARAGDREGYALFCRIVPFFP